MKKNFVFCDFCFVNDRFLRFKIYFLVFEFLWYNKNSFGWGWNNKDNCIEVFDDVWERYVVVG